MQVILERWRRALLVAHAGSGSHRAIVAFLKDPTEETRRQLGMNSVHGGLGQDTLAALAQHGDLSEARQQDLAALHGLIKH